MGSLLRTWYKDRIKKIWHKDLVRYLPDEILVQLFEDCWRGYVLEVIRYNGKYLSPEFEKVTHYNKSHFYSYCLIIVNELEEREITHEIQGYDYGRQDIYDFVSDEERQISSRVDKDNSLFYGWHNERYLVQCYYELQLLFDCGLIDKDCWFSIYKHVKKIVDGFDGTRIFI